jgi:hypothetical protein
MLPGFRFLAATITLTLAIVVFGLGAAALLRATHENFTQASSLRPAPEPVFKRAPEGPAPTLAMLRVEVPSVSPTTTTPAAPSTVVMVDPAIPSQATTEPSQATTEPLREAPVAAIAPSAESDGVTPSNTAGSPSDEAIRLAAVLTAATDQPASAPTGAAVTAATSAAAPADTAATSSASTRIAALDPQPADVKPATAESKAANAARPRASKAARRAVRAKLAAKRHRVVARASRPAQPAVNDDPFGFSAPMPSRR